MADPENRKQHVDFQRSFFDQHVDIFKKEIPEDVEARSEEIVRSILSGRDAAELKLLDVGTGVGAFLKHYCRQGVLKENIIGCDLSTEMLAEARQRYPDVHFWQGDVLDFPEENGPVDLIIFNACFGNIFDPFLVMKKCVRLLRANGRIAISHPLGNTCVTQLMNLEPGLVLRLLPQSDDLAEWCEKLSLELIVHRDETDLYLAIFDANNRSPEKNRSTQHSSDSAEADESSQA